MLGWLRRNAEPLGAIGAIATAFAALSALIIIPVQIGEADRIQRDQTAREIYREFLNLTVQKPELAQADFCTMYDAKDIAAYGAYVEYALYTAEQMVGSSPDWRARRRRRRAGRRGSGLHPANHQPIAVKARPGALTARQRALRCSST